MEDFKAYQENIISTYKELLDFREALFTRIICVGMSGELKEIQDTFQEGDAFHFEMEMFRDLKDINVSTLMDFYDQLETCMNFLSTQNNIREEDLEQEDE